VAAEWPLCCYLGLTDCHLPEMAEGTTAAGRVYAPLPSSPLLAWLSHQYFSLTTNQLPVTSQQHFFLRTNQHQPSATSQPNRLCRGQKDHASKQFLCGLKLSVHDLFCTKVNFLSKLNSFRIVNTIKNFPFDKLPGCFYSKNLGHIRSPKIRPQT
jgi:hypothetical protein